MNATPSAKHDEVRRRLANDVAAFLSSGRKIQEVDHTANKGWRNRKKKMKPHVPMHITPKHNPRDDRRIA